MSVLSEISANRRGRSNLSSRQRDLIVEKRCDGFTIKETCAIVNCSRTTIQETMRRWRKHHTTQDLPRSGRPKITHIREDRALYRNIRKDPEIKYRDLAKAAALDQESPLRQTPPSKATMYRRLKLKGLHKYKSPKRPRLKPEHAQKRLGFERDWRYFQWHNTCVKFSDECSVQRDADPRSKWIFRFPWEKYDRKMIKEVSKSKSMSQMVWGAIWIDSRGRPRRSELIIMERDPDGPNGGYTAESYIQALERGLLPHYRRGQLFQQDNVGIHTSHKVADFMRDHHINVMAWPPFSPDLNPIEHMWMALKDKLHDMYPDLHTDGTSQDARDRLRACLKAAWRAIPGDFILAVINSMPDRLAAMKKARGYQTKY